MALRHEVGLFDRTSGAFQRLCTIEDGDPDTRLNDGKVGPDGAFWVGSMDDRGKPASERKPLGSLYRVDGSGRVEKKVEGLITSNGLAWSADGRAMFHTDTSGRVDRPLGLRPGDRRHRQPHAHRRRHRRGGWPAGRRRH